MRLIDADALDPYFYEHCDDNAMVGAKNALDEMPTIDAVPVVRCKDCKYWERDAIFKDGWCRGKQQGNPEWFCADGERREYDEQ